MSKLRQRDLLTRTLGHRHVADHPRLEMELTQPNVVHLRRRYLAESPANSFPRPGQGPWRFHPRTSGAHEHRKDLSTNLLRPSRLPDLRFTEGIPNHRVCGGYRVWLN